MSGSLPAPAGVPDPDPDPEPGFDVFVSYKSQDANEVRAVVDLLRADGLRVWFAEYHILTEDYQNFQEVIDRGIHRSSNYILVTNRNWAASAHCREEARQIRRRLHEGRIGVSNLIEIAAPRDASTYEVFPELRQAASIEGLGDLEELVTRLGRHLGRAPRPPSPLVAEVRDTPEGGLRPTRAGARLALGTLTEAPRPLATMAPDRFPGDVGFFRGEVEGRVVRLLVNVNPFATALGTLTVEQNSGVDDRALYLRFLESAQRWYPRHGYGERGLHLFHWGGHTNLALTYDTAASSDGLRNWQRRYAIVARSPDGAETGEVDLSFDVDLPGDEEQTAREFFRLVPVFEAIAGSLRYDPGPCLANEAALFLRTKLVIFAVVMALGQGLYASSRTSFSTCLGMAMMGLAAADLGLFLVSRRIRRGFVMARLIGSGSLSGSPSRTPAEHALERWLVALLALPVVPLIGASAVTGLAFVTAGLVFRVVSPWYWGLSAAVLTVQGLSASSSFLDRHSGPTVSTSEGLEGMRHAPIPMADFQAPAPGCPDFRRPFALNAISPRLSPLLAQLRSVDRIPFRRCLQEAGLVLVLVSLLSASGRYGLAAGSGAVLLALVGIQQFRSLSRDVPEAIRGDLRTFERYPSPRLAADIAARYAQLAERTGRGLEASRAIQWAAKAIESSNDPGAERALARRAIHALRSAKDWPWWRKRPFLDAALTQVLRDLDQADPGNDRGEGGVSESEPSTP